MSFEKIKKIKESLRIKQQTYKTNGDTVTQPKQK